MRKLFQFDVYDSDYKSGRVAVQNGYVIANDKTEAEFKVSVSFEKDSIIKVKDTTCNYVSDSQNNNPDVFLNVDLI